MSNPALRVDRLGSGWMVVSAALFALMGAFAKAAGSRFGFSFNELVFWRMLFGLVAIGLPEWWRHKPFRTPYLKSHLNRSITGSVALLLSFFAPAAGHRHHAQLHLFAVFGLAFLHLP